MFPFGGVVSLLLGVSRPGGAFADDWRGHVGEIRRVYFEQHLPIKVDRADAIGRALDIRKVVRGKATEFKRLSLGSNAKGHRQVDPFVSPNFAGILT